jgi:very-short-patch-repair endonuclease
MDDLEKLWADLREITRRHDAIDAEVARLLSLRRGSARPAEPDEFAREFAEDAAELARAEYTRMYATWAARCESPIEKIMSAAIIHQARQRWRDFCPNQSLFFMGGGYVWPEDGLSDFDGCFLYQQAAVGKYRADILIRLFDSRNKQTNHTIVIECDGHDYHERTKEQAERDRSRDRWMTAQGITVLRFTGAEIWRDPVACCQSIFDVILRLLEYPEDRV